MKWWEALDERFGSDFWCYKKFIFVLFRILKNYLVSEVSTVLRKYTDRAEIGVSIRNRVIVFRIVGIRRVGLYGRRKNWLLLRRMRNDRRNRNDIIWEMIVDNCRNIYGIYINSFIYNIEFMTSLLREWLKHVIFRFCNITFIRVDHFPSDSEEESG